MSFLTPEEMQPFKSVGEDVKIGRLAKLVRPEKIVIGSHVRIDDFTVIVAGEDHAPYAGVVQIGSHVHIASFVSVLGGGSFWMEDFSTLAAGVRVFTGTDDYDGKGMTNPTVPEEFTRCKLGSVKIGRHVIVGANTVILPEVTLYVGCAIGACSLVRDDMPVWSVCWGVPCRQRRERERRRIFDFEEELLKRKKV